MVCKASSPSTHPPGSGLGNGPVRVDVVFVDTTSTYWESEGPLLASSQTTRAYLIMAHAFSGMAAIAFLHSLIHPHGDGELGLGGQGGGDDVAAAVARVGPDHHLPARAARPGSTDRVPDQAARAVPGDGVTSGARS